MAEELDPPSQYLPCYNHALYTRYRRPRDSLSSPLPAGCSSFSVRDCAQCTPSLDCIHHKWSLLQGLESSEKSSLGHLADPGDDFPDDLCASTSQGLLPRNNESAGLGRLEKFILSSSRQSEKSDSTDAQP